MGLRQAVVCGCDCGLELANWPPGVEVKSFRFLRIEYPLLITRGWEWVTVGLSRAW